MGLPLFHSFKHQLFDKIKENQGFSKYDMSNDALILNSLQ